MQSQNLINKSGAQKKSDAWQRKSAQQNSHDMPSHPYDALENANWLAGDLASAAECATVIQRQGLLHRRNDTRRVQTFLRLQRLYGNRFVQRVIAQHDIQAKLKIGQPGDIYEQEADRIAEQVMKMAEPPVQRQPEEEEEREEELQAKESPSQTAEVAPDLESRINAIKGGGQPLPTSTRAFFEPRFGYNFSQVRVHRDGEADLLNRHLNARAFTTGRDIVFGAGQYAPGTTKGRRLLAHELTHVIHQTGGRLQRQLTVGQPRDIYEQEADRVAQVVMQRELQATPKEADEVLVQRQLEEEEEAIQTQAEKTLVQRQQQEVIPKDELATVSPEMRVGRKIVQETEEELTTEQTVHFEQEKDDHIEHSIARETSSTTNGHLSEWITESHSVTKSGTDYVVTINELKLHTQVYIWPENKPGQWDNIANFGQYYGKPYSAAFNLYEGTLRHEKQHVVEAVNAFNAHEPWFRGEVAKIKEPTKAAAEAKYQALFNQLKTRYNASYWANGEVDGRRVEWEYYHEQYEKFTADPLTYGLFDWAITDADAQKVLKILEDLDNRGAAGFQKMVRYLDSQGLLNRLLDNISYADKKTYKSLIAKIYQLL